MYNNSLLANIIGLHFLQNLNKNKPQKLLKTAQKLLKTVNNIIYRMLVFQIRFASYSQLFSSPILSIEEYRESFSLSLVHGDNKRGNRDNDDPWLRRALLWGDPPKWEILQWSDPHFHSSAKYWLGKRKNWSGDVNKWWWKHSILQYDWNRWLFVVSNRCIGN